MARLRQRDLAAFSHALATLYADTGPDTLSQRILACLQGLFACEFADLSLVDLRRQRWHSVILSPAPSEWPGQEVFQRLAHEQPVAAHSLRTGDPFAFKNSDFLSLRQYRALGIYDEVFRKVGCDRLLGFVAHPAAPLTLGVGLHRKGRDFSEEQRSLLDLLRPHLLQAYGAARAAQRVRDERERENLGDASGAGLCEVDATGRLLWITRRAEALLAVFFPPQGQHPCFGRLPASLWDRLRASLRRDNRLLAPGRQGGYFTGPEQRSLSVRLVAGASSDRWQVLLEETSGGASESALRTAFQLTPREAEVLGWVGQGKTNWEIGAILGIAEKTAGKHLENIFAKLNVENRTAAARMANEVSAGP
jgi:DNA-binding CsgD family transcriptional regulator